MAAAESASVRGLVSYWKRRFGFEPVEAEVRAVARLSPEGRVLAFTKPTASGHVYKGTVRSAYAQIRAPALAIYATHYTVAQYFPAVATFDAENRRMAETFVAAQRQYEERQIARFRGEVPRATVLEIPGANHYVHYSHPARVERAMRTFLQAELRHPSRPTRR
jgi:pimeloyl-ACP methyl ester carboxylesterase